MKILLPLLLATLGAVPASADDRLILAEDDASAASYRSGWKGEGGGTGFRGWSLRLRQPEGGASHAGFYIGGGERAGEPSPVALRGKTFSLYANGAGFEVAAAFRALKKPLRVGQTFSFLVGHTAIERKADRDDAASGAIGLTLRSGHPAEGVEDYKRESRFEFGAYEGQATYRIYDGEAEHDTGLALTDRGLSVSFTLLTPDTYELEITTLGERKTTTLKPRKLGGASGAPIESFCIFNRDGEKSDAHFNGFQIAGPDR